MGYAEDPAVTEWRETLDFAVQQAAEKHLEGCEAALAHAEGAWDEGGQPPEDPSYAPYCGCTTCIVREVLTAAWMHVWQTAPKSDPVREALQREWQ